MKAKKKTVLCTLLIAIGTFIILILSFYYFQYEPYNEIIKIIMSSISTGMIVSCNIALMEYFSEKRKFIIRFYLDCNKAISSISSWGPRLELHTASFNNFVQSVDNIIHNVSIISEEYYIEYSPFLKKTQQNENIKRILGNLIAFNEKMSQSVNLLYEMHKNKNKNNTELQNEYSELSVILFGEDNCKKGLFQQIEQDKCTLEQLVGNSKKTK